MAKRVTKIHNFERVFYTKLLVLRPVRKSEHHVYIIYVRMKCTTQNSSRARNRFVAPQHTEVVWHTSQSSHAIWCSPTRPHMDWRRDWLCDGDWTLGIGQWDLHIFLRRDQCLIHVRIGEVERTQISPPNDLGTCICVSPSAAELCLQMSSAWGLKFILTMILLRWSQLQRLRSPPARWCGSCRPPVPLRSAPQRTRRRNSCSTSIRRYHRPSWSGFGCIRKRRAIGDSPTPV